MPKEPTAPWWQTQGTLKAFASILAIGAGLLTGFVVLHITNPQQALSAFNTMLFAGVRSGLRSVGNVIYFASPMILTGLSVALAFKAGLFNIGATGQMLVGAYVALHITIRWSFLGPAAWIVGILLAIATGALWGVIPGVLKALKGVHEVVATIMMNYVALFLVNLLVRRNIYSSLNNESLPVPPGGVIPKFGLDTVFSGSNIQGAFVIAMIATALVSVLLNRTVLGYELQAVGFNRHSSRYAGIDEKSRIVIAMMISGGLAGAAGAGIYLSDSLTFLKVHDILPTEGFMGISVALLGMKEPIGVFLAGLFFGYLKVGGQTMQLFDLAPEVIDVITGMIVYFSALSLAFEQLALKAYRALSKRSTR